MEKDLFPPGLAKNPTPRPRVCPPAPALVPVQPLSMFLNKLLKRCLCPHGCVSQSLRKPHYDIQFCCKVL
ncbi:hypothetical protein ILYODFUR_013067 [Ilyodon furcidens]|uniref:Uncharacterized protein n=1 Tax=Ilyodon furcidens TaxID=33524 RepID=A0ABV0V2N0_9TELE